MDLLPKSDEEFRSKKYWDAFFTKTRSKPFEWYGEWQQLRPLLMSALRQDDVILVPGCGNSELSNEIYDAGFGQGSVYSEQQEEASEKQPRGSGKGSIVNVDFSDIVIREMEEKSKKQRPLMAWLVRDMTDTKFPSASFDVVVDKGGLDALMGEEKDETESGKRFLEEVDRLLTPRGGRYLCVTLAQEHVISLLLRTFRSGWTLTIHRVPPAASDSSPLKPFLVVATKAAATAAVTTAEAVAAAATWGQTLHSEQGLVPLVVTTVPRIAADGMNPDQLASLFAAVDAENEIRRATPSSPALGVPSANQNAAPVHVSGDQEPSHRVQKGLASLALEDRTKISSSPEAFDFDRIDFGRRAVVSLGGDLANSSLPGGGQTANPEVPRGISGGDVQQLKPRFTAVVLDAALQEAANRALTCGVFIVPQGREHEWLFCSTEGQSQLATSASAQRLIIVSLNRGHSFGSSEEVQAELSPLVLPLLPKSIRGAAKSVPFMTTSDGIGERKILEEIMSPMTGRILVEEVELEGEEINQSSSATSSSSSSSGRTTFRRLVFERNLNLVQSEALVIRPEGQGESQSNRREIGSKGDKDGGTKKAEEAKKKTKLKNAKKASKAKAEKAPQNNLPVPAESSTREIPGNAANSFSSQSLSLAASQSASSVALLSREPDSSGRNSPGQDSSNLDHSYLASQYHSAMLAGLALLGPQLESSAKAGQLSALLIGLGGGSLPMFLRRHFPFNKIKVVELDPVIADVAQRHFGFQKDTVMTLEVDDGIRAVKQLAAGRCESIKETAAEQKSSESSRGPQAGDEERRAGSQEQASSGCSAPAKSEGEGGVSQPLRDETGGHAGGALDAIFVDADSGDASLPMSCPPAEFLDPIFLSASRCSLKERGLLIVNFVSRSPEAYSAAIASLHSEFAELYEINLEEDVNKVVVCLKAPFGQNGIASGIKRSVITLVAMAMRHAPWGRGPSLVKLVDRIKRLE